MICTIWANVYGHLTILHTSSTRALGQVHPKGCFFGVEVRGLCKTLEFFHPTSASHVFIVLTVCIEHFHSRTSFGPLFLVMVTCNGTAYRDILYICVLQTLCQQIGQAPGCDG